jgi:hypothetical protein
MRELNLEISRDEEAGDWSIAINGLRYEHVSSHILEDLVECAVLVAENSLLGPTLLGSGHVPPFAIPKEFPQGHKAASAKKVR